MKPYFAFRSLNLGFSEVDVTVARDDARGVEICVALLKWLVSFGLSWEVEVPAP